MPPTIVGNSHGEFQRIETFRDPIRGSQNRGTSNQGRWSDESLSLSVSNRDDEIVAVNHFGVGDVAEHFGDLGGLLAGDQPSLS